MSRSKSLALSAAVGVAGAVLVANVASAQDRGFGRRHRDGDMMFFFPLLLLIAVAALLILLWRSRHPAAAPAPPSASPTFNAQSILADRLARGEITPDDYRAAITVLREPPPPATPA